MSRDVTQCRVHKQWASCHLPLFATTIVPHDRLFVCAATGEMSHHEVLAASVAGKSVILTEHSNCERGFLPHLAEALRGELNARTEANNFSIIISDVDADPLVTV